MGRIEELKNRVAEVKKINRMVPKTNINVVMTGEEAEYLLSRLQIAEEALSTGAIGLALVNATEESHEFKVKLMNKNERSPRADTEGLRMKIEKGVTYWGYAGKRETERRVNIIETRNSGTQYVNWTHIKKDGTEGKHQWSRLEKFKEWAKGVFERV